MRRTVFLLIFVALAVTFASTVAQAQPSSAPTTQNKEIVPYQATGYKYKVVSPGGGAGFEKSDFDDSSFSTGNAAFGGTGFGCPLENTVKTNWPVNTDILVRKSFELPPNTKNLKVRVAIDNKVQAFINGEDISGGMQDSGGCAVKDRYVFTAPDNILQEGTNVLAVRGNDYGAIAYLDVRVTAEVPLDTTKPVLYLPADKTEEATSDSGAAVTFSATANDAVDGNVPVSCASDPVGDPPVELKSGDTFPVATTKVNCSATDKAGNKAEGSFYVKVQDTTKPTLSGIPFDITAEAKSSSGSPVSYTLPTATDAVDGSVSVKCSPASESTFPIETTKVTCSATDKAGNTGTGSFYVTVKDTTAPTISVPSDITVTATEDSGANVTYSATATDVVDGSVSVSCEPASGSFFKAGTTTVSCSASDRRNNVASPATFKVNVVYDFAGFGSPIKDGALNTGKGGRTYPIKWQLKLADGNLVSDEAAQALLASMSAGQKQTECSSFELKDEHVLESATSGEAGLRYDSDSNQFIYNYKSPSTPGCYILGIRRADGFNTKQVNFEFTG